MKRILFAAFLAFIFVGTVGAQAVPPGHKKGSGTSWLLDLEGGGAQGLGYKLPYLAFGFSFEQPVGKHVELQGQTIFSPDKTVKTNDGFGMKIKTRELYWITSRFAVSGEVGRSREWTSQFKQTSWSPAAGVAVRENILDFPGRMYFAYIFPTGCQWGANCLVQSNRLQGGQFNWEKLMTTHIRFGFTWDVYHVLNQSNRFQPTIPRTGRWTGDSLLILRYDIGGRNPDNTY